MFLLIGWIDFCTKTNVLLRQIKIDVYILLSFCLFYLRLIISREIAHQWDSKIKYIYMYCYVLKLLLQFLLFMLLNVICTSEFMYPQSHKAISSVRPSTSISTTVIIISKSNSLSFVDLSNKLSRIN